MNNFIITIKVIAGILLFVLFLGLGIGTSNSIPSNAQVYVDDSKKIYIGIPSAPDPVPKQWRLITIQEARALKYNPDNASKNNGDFVQEGRSLSGMLLEKIGVLSPLKSRWNKDGSWNW